MGARSAERSQAAAQQQADQDAEIAQLQAQQAPAAAPAPAELDVVAQIQKFATLKDQGLITEEEFAAKKKQLLGI
jgi:membrane protease subunit (stomatin/prohibitin family)